MPPIKKNPSVLPPHIQNAAKKIGKRREGPLWKGPEQDGVTFSLLSRFLCCRERFRLLVVEGLKPAEGFNSRIEFGNMWHVCEETLAKEVPGRMGQSGAEWNAALGLYCQSLSQQYPMDREQISHWYAMAQALFPIYVKHWAGHKDVVSRKPLLQEQPFNVPYKLPSGRTVRLRGKWDAVDLIDGSGVWLQENKTKSSIDQIKLQRQLTFDLQTMMYLVALKLAPLDNAVRKQLEKVLPRPWVGIKGARGVRYNVVRRSAHKSVESMLKKIEDDRKANRMGEWFARWNVEVMPGDIERFQRQCLNPILEQLCDWWGHICNGGDPFGEPFSVDGPQTRIHWRHPFGVYNVLDEGGSSELDQYLSTGSEIGLQRTDNLFPELT